MPFTFSHPSVVLIIRKLFPVSIFSLTGLVVGSIVPDFEGILFMQTTKIISHTWTGLFLFDLPLGFAICLMWHNIIKVPLIEHAPCYLKKRFYGFKDIDWNAYLSKHKLIVLTSLIIGITTHILWDEYTHFNGTDYSAVIIFKNEMSIFIFLQLLSSVIGVVVIWLFIAHMPQVSHVPFSKGGGYWFITFEGAIICLLLKILMTNNNCVLLKQPAEFVSNIMLAGMLGIILASITCKQRKVL
jgi:hypothetical protein